MSLALTGCPLAVPRQPMSLALAGCPHAVPRQPMSVALAGCPHAVSRQPMSSSDGLPEFARGRLPGVDDLARGSQR